LGRLTKLVTEAALEGEMDDHLGYDKHDPAGRNGGNSRNGKWAEDGVDRGWEIAVPRDRTRVRADDGEEAAAPSVWVDDLVISLSAKGMARGEIAAHLAEIYGAEVSKQTISTITDRVMDGMVEW
jgi:putative transposase